MEEDRAGKIKKKKMDMGRTRETERVADSIRDSMLARDSRGR